MKQKSEEHISIPSLGWENIYDNWLSPVGQRDATT